MRFPVIDAGQISSVVAGMELIPFRDHLHRQNRNKIRISKPEQVRTLPHIPVLITALVKSRHILPAVQVRTPEQDNCAVVLFSARADYRIIQPLFLLIPDLGIAEIFRAVSFRKHIRRHDRVVLVFDIIHAVAKSQALRLAVIGSFPFRVSLLFHPGIDEQMPAVRRCDRAA